jgi:hypothetical protein
VDFVVRTKQIAMSQLFFLFLSFLGSLFPRELLSNHPLFGCNVAYLYNVAYLRGTTPTGERKCFQTETLTVCKHSLALA